MLYQFHFSLAGHLRRGDLQVADGRLLVREAQQRVLQLLGAVAGDVGAEDLHY